MIRRALLSTVLTAAAFAVTSSAQASPNYTWTLNGFTDNGEPQTITAENVDTGTLTVTFNAAVLQKGGTTLYSPKVTLTYEVDGKTFSGTVPGPVTLTQGEQALLDGNNASGNFAFFATLGGGDGNYTLQIDDPGIAIGSATYYPASGGYTLVSTSTITAIGLAGMLPYSVGAPIMVNYAFSDSAGLSDAGATYQWLRDGDPIEGATADTYNITDADVNTQLMCCVIPHNEYTERVSGATSCMSNFIALLGSEAPSGDVLVPMDNTWKGAVTITLDGVKVGDYADGAYNPINAGPPPGGSSSETNTWEGQWPDDSSTVQIYTYGTGPDVQFVVEGDVLTISS